MLLRDGSSGCGGGTRRRCERRIHWLWLQQVARLTSQQHFPCSAVWYGFLHLLRPEVRHAYGRERTKERKDAESAGSPSNSRHFRPQVGAPAASHDPTRRRITTRIQNGRAPKFTATRRMYNNKRKSVNCIDGFSGDEVNFGAQRLTKKRN